ncbi:MAG: transposase [Candidatus Methylumidiphilus sp.]
MKEYCQFLIATIINFTQTYMADHNPVFSHDAITRYLVDDDVSPSAVWQSIGHLVRRSGNACLIFDDNVLDKRHSFNMELVRPQYSGNEHGVVKGIGVVNCLYVNMDANEHWIIDWRIYDGDGKNKLDHVRDMLDNAIAAKSLPFRAVLMDSWYATKDLMMHRTIHKAGKLFYCPLKANRKVDGSGGKNPYKAVSSLDWFDDEMLRGKLVKIHGLPMGYKVKLFRVAATNRTEYVATNDLSQDSAVAVQDMCAIRWKAEQYHREGKHTLGLEKWQCRKARAQRNHIGCAILAWHCLTSLARKLGESIYALKNGLLSEYMKKELKNPSIPFSLA